MLLHDKTAGADFLDEVRVKPVRNCQSVVRTSGNHYMYLPHLLISNLFLLFFKLTELYCSAFIHVVIHCR